VPSCLNIFERTPKTNCKQCGEATCMAFAQKAESGAVKLEACPFLSFDASDMSRYTDAEKKEKHVIIRLPNITKWEVYTLTPRTDCKQCGFRSCVEFSEVTVRDAALISLCPYIKETVWWLTPRTDCAECTYPPCAEFVKAVASGRVSPVNCPHTVRHQKEDNYTTQAPKSAKQSKLETDKEKDVPLQKTARDFIKEIEKANDRIADEAISADLSAIAAHVTDIYEMASRTAEAQRTIRKFNSIYLPKTIKLLGMYIELDGRKAQTVSVLSAKSEIGQAIAGARQAFEQLNEDLLAQMSLDTEAEIAAFKSMLAIDGYLDENKMEMPQDNE